MSQFSRRTFLRTTAVAATATAVMAKGASKSNALDHAVFQHGVASGDPTASSVILWTRVTPDPTAVPGSGVGEDTVVVWEIAESSDFRTLIASGTTTATATRDHTVHVSAIGLRPATTYFYRFHADGQVSTTGRTKTTTLADAPLALLRLAVASCANWEAGYFAAYGDIARRAQADELDVMVFLGDYIYEYSTGMFAGKSGVVRPHHPLSEIISLADYRARYGHYRSDLHLQAVHAVLPWIVMWDDHESANNSNREGAENHQPNEGSWTDRLTAARQAFLEWMPIRQEDTLYRAFVFGDLATLSLLDLRSFRDPSPSPEGWLSGQRADTMMGSEQFAWLKETVQQTTSKWNVIGSSVMFAPMALTGQLFFQLPEPIPANLDQWDGYAQERDRLLNVLADSATPTLFLAGDIHSEWGNSIIANGQEIGVEVVCSSITSANVDDFAHLPEDNPISLQVEQVIRSQSSHVRHVDLDAHGYASVTLTPGSTTMSWHRVSDITSPESPVFHAVTLEWKPGPGFTS
ncbi:phosphodiesterase/alkaline phosphatase D [Corynebacterium deserti GIMN1.010]|uniref:Phosphodiesterase/alkaline phosphatase D n=1 Tax=Corynebacterium deserti GIMN1.010 TaxID=931089 RepID=A0A0M4CH41_9CORY|nr:alkaline phosphatase D family protein [Corynebacterium deserti]ALC06427.1 phosphodiesterase/alkaline phosphatase D [Corynebacterium deserti GIMN1.010]